MLNKKLIELKKVLKEKIIPKTIEVMERLDVLSVPITTLNQHHEDYFNIVGNNKSPAELSLGTDGFICNEKKYLESEDNYIYNNCPYYDLNKLTYIDGYGCVKSMSMKDIINCASELLCIIDSFEKKENEINTIIEKGRKINFIFEKRLLIEKKHEPKIR